MSEPKVGRRIVMPSLTALLDHGSLRDTRGSEMPASSKASAASCMTELLVSIVMSYTLVLKLNGVRSRCSLCEEGQLTVYLEDLVVLELTREAGSE